MSTFRALPQFPASKERYLFYLGIIRREILEEPLQVDSGKIGNTLPQNQGTKGEENASNATLTGRKEEDAGRRRSPRN